MSLARKISLLFGSAVLLTICATLLFPLIQMNNLDSETLLMQASWSAGTAYQAVDLRQPDWDAAQRRLEAQWPNLAKELGIPSSCPTLIRAKGTPLSGSFRPEAIRRLRRDSQQRYYWRSQNNGKRFRFALAVRTGDTDVHPGTLRGIIDVSIPVSQQNANWNYIVTILAGASGAVLAILIFYMVTQRLVLSPVATLKQAAEQVTSGDISVRSSIASGDEFQDLSESFNKMLAHLRTAQDKLRNTNRSLDIRLGELAETNVALYESVKIRSEFLANVSHELRTPLVSIIGFAELLRESWDNPSADRKRLSRYSENILTSGRGLLDIINDLLDLAKIEAGKLQLNLADFSIGDLCNDLIDFVRPLADKKKQVLVLDAEKGLPPFHSDSGKIKQVLYNLLSNAVKFTPDGGSISLTVARHNEDSVRITVSDSGPGIPEDQQAMIFDKFHQVDASKTREFEGAGLGLAISRELVQMLGGIIELAGSSESGATFFVELPTTAPENSVRPPIRLT